MQFKKLKLHTQRPLASRQRYKGMTSRRHPQSQRVIEFLSCSLEFGEYQGSPYVIKWALNLLAENYKVSRRRSLFLHNCTRWLQLRSSSFLNLAIELSFDWNLNLIIESFRPTLYNIFSLCRYFDKHNYMKKDFFSFQCQWLTFKSCFTQNK